MKEMRGRQSELTLASALLAASGAVWLGAGLLNLGALVLGQLGGGTEVPGAMYPMLEVDGWLFSLLCVLSFSLIGALGLAGGWAVWRRRYWARSIALSFSLMAAVSGLLLATYTYLAPGLLSFALHLLFAAYLLRSSTMEESFPIWISRYGRGASQFSLLFLINATAFGSLVVGPLLPLLRFRHMSGGSYGVPLCSLGSIARSLSGNWADLLLAPVLLIAVLMLVGLLVGRALCGWACPIGFLHDLATRTKAMGGLGDLEPSRGTHDRLRLVKYAVLLFVLLLAINIGVTYLISPDARDEFVLGMAGFPLFQAGATPCEACPAPITGYFLPDDLVRNGVQGRFVMTPEAGLRIFVLLGFIVGAFLMPRFFCRYFCPVGAIAAPFNRVSALSIEKEQEKCTECNYCVTACPMRIHRLREERVDSRVHDTECTFCLECIDSCPERALSLSFQGRTIYRGGKEWWLRLLKETETRRRSGWESGPRAQRRTSRQPSLAPVTPARSDIAGAPLALLLITSALGPLFLAAGAAGEEYGPGNLPLKDASGNYTLASGDRLTVTGGNLTLDGSLILEENASFVVEGGATVTVNGDLWLAGESSMRVDNSTLRVNIPEQPPMRLEQLYEGPNGFVLIDEGASFKLSGSRLVLSRLPGTLMQGIARPGFGGTEETYTYSITYTDPDDRPSSWLSVVIDGAAHNLTKADPDDTTSRDGMQFTFATTLPKGNHSYHFEGLGPDGPLRYPTAGELPGPHVGTDEPIFLFGSEMLVNFGTFEASNSTLDMSGTLYTHMDSRLHLDRSSINAGLTIEINPLCVIRESNVPSMVVKERTGLLNVLLYDCTVGTAVVESVSEVLFERCAVENLDLQSDSSTTLIDSTVRYLNSGSNATATLDMTRVTAADFPYMRMAGSSRLFAFNGTSLGIVHMHDSASLYITNSEVRRVEAHGDARIWSEYATVFEHELSENATILNTLKLRATLNDRPARVGIKVYSPGGAMLVSTTTLEDGYRSFAVPTRIIRPEGIEVMDWCILHVTYMSLESVQNHSLANGSSEIKVSLEDLEAPVISGVEFDYYYRIKGEALVRARVTDGAGAGVRDVVVRYSVSGGGERSAPLFPLGGGLYEGSLTGLKSASEVRFRVVATDWMNNTSSSPARTVTVDLTPSTAAAALGGAAALAAAGGFLMALRYFRTRRYIRRERPGEK